MTRPDHAHRDYRWRSRFLMLRDALRRPLAERFWLNVDASAGIDGCWPWRGSRSHQGYGRLSLGTPPQAVEVRAHRVALEVAGVPVPPDMLVLHSCDNPPCVNPAHLRVGTQRENIRDMDDRGRRRPQTHCKRGHAFTPDNVRRRRGQRYCLTCLRARGRAMYYTVRDRQMRGAA